MGALLLVLGRSGDAPGEFIFILARPPCWGAHAYECVGRRRCVVVLLIHLSCAHSCK